MNRALVVLAIMLVPIVMSQPDIGPILDPINEAAGTAVPPAAQGVVDLTGQNISREDIRLFLDLNITKGGVGVVGLLLGSGKAELEATIKVRGEFRVISSDRIRAAIEGENAYNIEAQNATTWSQLFIPAEVFRASLSAEVIAAFQEGQEKAMREYVAKSVPEMEIISLDLAWENTHVFNTLSDLSLTEPPIIVELEAKVRYLRVESVPSLLDMYINREPKGGNSDHISDLKKENSDPLRTRDFFAAAAFSQLLNLSMQPGWSLEIGISLPRGYSIEYANEALQLDGDRRATFYLDAQDSDSDVEEVIVFSLTHRKAVVTAMFVMMLAAVGVLNLFGRWAYGRYRMPYHRK